jgi:hypothetical protein
MGFGGDYFSEKGIKKAPTLGKNWRFYIDFKLTNSSCLQFL